MELAHVSYKRGTFEDYVGLRGLKRLGKKKWKRHVAFVVARWIAALHPDDVVLGEGTRRNSKHCPQAPEQPTTRMRSAAFACENAPDATDQLVAKEGVE
jgi:polyphosphate glucokinase